MDEQTFKLEGAVIAQGHLLAYLCVGLALTRREPGLPSRLHQEVTATIERVLERNIAAAPLGSPERAVMSATLAGAIEELDRVLGVAQGLLQRENRPDGE